MTRSSAKVTDNRKSTTSWWSRKWSCPPRTSGNWTTRARRSRTVSRWTRGHSSEKRKETNDETPRDEMNSKDNGKDSKDNGKDISYVQWNA
jgi:hypothetical protein